MKREIGMHSLICAMILAGSLPVFAELEVFGTSPTEFKIVGASETNPAFRQVLASVNPWGLASHPDTGVVYFSDPTAGIIGSIDPSLPVPVIKEIINRPGAVFHGIALDAPNNRLFFLDSSNNSVNVVDLGTLTEKQLIAGFGIMRPNEIVYDAVRNLLLFSDSGADGLWVIDDLGNMINGFTLPETQGIWGLALHPGTRDIYFSSHDQGGIHILDPATGTATTVATGLKGPRGLEFDRFGRLFCMESGLGRVTQVPLAGQSVKAPVFADAVNGRAFLVFEGSDRDGDLLPDEWERKFASSLFVLNAESDPDKDGRSAFDEWMFNVTPTSSADPAPLRSLDLLSSGGLSAIFEGPRGGCDFGVLLSSDMENWQPWTGALVEAPLSDSLFSSWQLRVENPAALGLDSRRVFIRLTGSVSQP